MFLVPLEETWNGRTLEKGFWYHLVVFVKSTPDLSKISTKTIEFFKINKVTTNFLKILRDKKEEIPIKEFSKSSKRFSQIKKKRFSKMDIKKRINDF